MMNLNYRSNRKINSFDSKCDNVRFTEIVSETLTMLVQGRFLLM